MPNFLKRFDGTGRTPRPVQVAALSWLAENWDAQVLCLNVPVGGGKSAIAKAVAEVEGRGCHIITPSNILVDQYCSTYPKHNALKGRTHYSCHGIATFSCQEWVDISGEEACNNCPYTEAKNRALQESTFFNPMSMYFLTLNAKWATPKTLIVDEAHTLSGMLLQMCGTRMRKSEYRFNEEHTNEVTLVPWLRQQLRKLAELAKIYKKDNKKFLQVTREISNLQLTLNGLSENAQNYAIWIEDGRFKGRPEQFLNIRPIRPPQFVVRKLLSARRIILMSGTLFDTDIKDLLGDTPYKMLDLPSPIPVANRIVQYSPVSFPMNKDTDGYRIVQAVEDEIKKHPTYNALVHVTYALSKRLAPQFRIPILYNDQTNKDEVLDEFKRRGGVFLAAGCAEGVDLPGDMCRLNIIPKLPFPDLSDPVVRKRKAVDGGEIWYQLQTFKTLIQQIGRSTRGETDWSLTIVKDPNFPRLYSRIKEFLPKSFKEAIKWSGT